MRYWLIGLVFCSVSAIASCPQWPLVIAHRGASGYLPEHSLPAYQLALAQGADFIEVDVVPSRDGVLIARHENELSHSTDVASRPEFADRYTKKQVDGSWQQGWFSEDFTLAELRSLRLKESMPKLRPQSAAHDGRYSIVTLAEVIQLLNRHQQQTGVAVGIYIETKHPAYFAYTAVDVKGNPVQQDITELLVDQLRTTPSLPAHIYIQSFEVSNLVRLRQQLLPAAGLPQIKLVQLLGDTKQQFLQPKDSFSEPFDIYGAEQGLFPLGLLTAELRVLLKKGFHYGDLTTTAGLAAVASYAEGIGPWRQNLYPQIGAETPLITQAAAAGLVVHPYTFRKESQYLLSNDKQQQMSINDELNWIFGRGIHGVFTDFPDIAVQARADVCTKKAN